jgi:hypothetical protein
MNSLTRTLTKLFAVGIATLSFGMAAGAQVQTKSTTVHGSAMKTISVEHGEVVYAAGRDLILKKADGTVVHFANVSETVTVDGKQVALDDLKPGMKLERSVTTTNTPNTVTTVEKITGKVWHVNPPRFVILTLEDGTNHQFDLPSDHKVTVDGRVVDAWHLKKGMKIAATRVIETPGNVVSQQIKVTGTSPMAAALPADEPIYFILLTPALAQSDLAEATPAVLPETGSSFPLIGFLGIIALGSSLGFRAVRANTKA